MNQVELIKKTKMRELETEKREVTVRNEVSQELKQDQLVLHCWSSGSASV